MRVMVFQIVPAANISNWGPGGVREFRLSDEMLLGGGFSLGVNGLLTKHFPPCQKIHFLSLMLRR
jgi:hypothetical protein